MFPSYSASRDLTDFHTIVYGHRMRSDTMFGSIEDKNLSGREFPRVLTGKGYGIVEDCGRTGGLELLAEAFQKKTGVDYEEYRDWLGRDDFDLSSIFGGQAGDADSLESTS